MTVRHERATNVPNPAPNSLTVCIRFDDTNHVVFDAKLLSIDVTGAVSGYLRVSLYWPRRPGFTLFA